MKKVKPFGIRVRKLVYENGRPKRITEFVKVASLAQLQKTKKNEIINILNTKYNVPVDKLVDKDKSSLIKIYKTLSFENGTKTTSTI